MDYITQKVEAAMYLVILKCSLNKYFFFSTNNILISFSVSYKGQLFIFGGCNSIHGKYYNDLVRYNPGIYLVSCFLKNILDPIMCLPNLDSCCWSVVETRGNGPSPRDGPCCCLIGDRVFLYGGLR